LVFGSWPARIFKAFEKNCSGTGDSFSLAIHVGQKEKGGKSRPPHSHQAFRTA
jgi:hypothetical protein